MIESASPDAVLCKVINLKAYKVFTNKCIKSYNGVLTEEVMKRMTTVEEQLFDKLSDADYITGTPVDAVCIYSNAPLEPLKRGKLKPKKRHVGIRIDEDMHRMLKAYCEAENSSCSTVISTLMENYLLKMAG